MKYRVDIDGSEREVDLHFAGDTPVVTLDGKPVDADVRRVAGGLSLILDHKVYDVMLGGPGDALDVAFGAARTRVSVMNERQRGRRTRGGGGQGAGELRAPMPGRIVEVSVAVGDSVEPGTPLVVIEAMKMQNELRSEVSGTVKSVDVAPEQNVESGALLVAIDVAG